MALNRAHRRWLAGGMTLVAVLALGSCAPTLIRPREIVNDLTRDRFERALALREQRAAGVEMEASLWVRGESLKDLPGVDARLLLSAPDAIRLRVESTFGTALDLSARGDRLTAYAPSARLAYSVPSSRDSLGLADPGPLGVRMWSATFRPPDDAWAGAGRVDSLLHLRWNVERDTLELAIGASGLPEQVSVTPARGSPVRVRYPSYAAWEGVFWPDRIEAQDPAGTFALTARVHRVRFVHSPEPGRFEIRIPPTVERLSGSRLRLLLERLQGL